MCSYVSIWICLVLLMNNKVYNIKIATTQIIRRCIHLHAYLCVCVYVIFCFFFTNVHKCRMVHRNARETVGFFVLLQKEYLWIETEENQTYHVIVVMCIKYNMFFLLLIDIIFIFRTIHQCLVYNNVWVCVCVHTYFLFNICLCMCVLFLGDVDRCLLY